MKKTILFFAIISFLFTGCSKDEDDEVFSVVGKTYAAYAYLGGGGSAGAFYDVYWVYKFISDNEVERTERKVSPTGEIRTIENCTYVLNYPDLTITRGSSINTATFVDQNTFRIETGLYIGEYILQ
jgi:hypothetical protein